MADVEYVLLADGRTAVRTAYSQHGIKQSRYVNYQDTEEKIRTDAINVARNLGMNNIVLYSIGFGNHQEVDMGYLEKLSAMTGGQAKQGISQNLTEIFQQFSKLATDPVLNGTVKIPLASFDGNVQIVETDQVWLDEKKENAYTPRLRFQIRSSTIRS